MHTLMLLPWMAPHKVISWQRAIVLSFLGKVEVITEYDEVIRSPSVALRAPAVVRMRRAHVPHKTSIRFCRANVFRRDELTCQYCGEIFPACDLTFDHVMPRSRGGLTEWTNIVTCCRPCNDRKRDRTPEQAEMKLLRRPVKPKWLPGVDLTALHLDTKKTPAEWAGFV
jgi:5-methylcytosine-specific restriction endonuclease McrA